MPPTQNMSSEKETHAKQAPAAKRAKREARPVLNDAMRAAHRAAERALHVGGAREVGILLEQIKQIHNDNELATTDEYETITKRLDGLAQHKARKDEQTFQEEINQKQLHDNCVRRSCKERDHELQKEIHNERMAYETFMAEFVADGAKKTGMFDCGVCLAEKPLARMRLITPCGHAFCAGCVAVLKETNRKRNPGGDAKGCPKCRGPMAGVLKPYF